MGKLYKFFVAAGLILLNLIFLSENSCAQSIPIGGRLYGEKIISSIHYKPTARIPSTFVATATAVYVMDNSSPPFSVPYARKVLTLPPGRTLKSITSKEEPYNLQISYDLITTVIFLNLDNGDVYAENVERADGFHYYSTVGPGGSESLVKVIGAPLFALTSNSVYTSRDSGASWMKDTAGLNNAHIYDISLDTGHTFIYAATSAGLYKKDTIQGSHWSKDTMFTGSINLYRVYVDSLDRMLVAGNGSGLWMCTNNGTTCSVDTGGLGPNGTLSVFGEDKMGSLFGADTHLYGSMNGTSPWAQIDMGILNLSVNTPKYNCIFYDSALFTGTSYGLFFSRNYGVTWQKSDSGLLAENISGLVKLNNGKLFMSTSLGLYSEDSATAIWKKYYPPDGYSEQLLPMIDDAGLFVLLDKNIPHPNNTPPPIVKSTNGGLTWIIDTAGLSAINGDIFYIDETGTQHYSNSYYGSSFDCNLWKRMPSGAWTIDTMGFPALNYSFVSSMASDKNGYLYVSGSFSGNKVMRRPIAGGTWVIDSAGIGSSVNRFTQMTTGHHGDIIGTVGNFLYHKNAGSWSRINLPASLSSVQITAAAVDSAGNIFAAFSNFSNLGKGVWYTANMGATWTKAGLDSIEVRQLIPYADTVYALTFGRGAYKMTANFVLPLKLLLFNAINRGSSNELIWETTEEVNTSHFEIERSANANDFSTIGKVHAAGNSSRTESYTFFDSSPLPIENYYRLKMEDIDGNYSYSKIVRLYSGEKTRIIVSPNPISGIVTISGLSPNLEKTLQLTDITGKIILQQKTINSVTDINMYDVPAGIYFLRIWSDHNQYTTKIVKQ